MYTDLLGVKFKVHGRNKAEGFDCYGLAMEVLSRNGILLPEIPYKDFNSRDKVREDIFSRVSYTRLEKPCKNCIINITERGNPVHVAVYIGDGKIIHATENMGVIIERLSRYEKRIEGFYKVDNHNLQKSV